MIQEALDEARRLAHENRLEGKDLDELAELEDDEDDDFLESYRQKRMAELATTSHASVYNQVYHLQKPEYSRDVHRGVAQGACPRPPDKLAGHKHRVASAGRLVARSKQAIWRCQVLPDEGRPVHRGVS